MFNIPLLFGGAEEIFSTPARAGHGKKYRRIVIAPMAEYTLAGKQQAAKRAARWLWREMTKGQTDKPPGHIAEKLKHFREIL